jgi:hypothetical protein
MNAHAEDTITDDIKKIVADKKATANRDDPGCGQKLDIKYVDLNGDGKKDLIIDYSGCYNYYCGATGLCALDVYIAGRPKKTVKSYGVIGEGNFLVRRWYIGSNSGKTAIMLGDVCRSDIRKSCETPIIWAGTKFETRPEQVARSTDDSAPKITASGTGFYVDGSGHILTNAHVVATCSSISVQSSKLARILFRDDKIDLALLKVDGTSAFARLRVGVRLGETVAAFGFPLRGVLAEGGNFTIGSVTAVAGLQDDTRRLQISTPVQPGNSGGPLLDEWGNVVGVVVSRLALDGTSVAPQNVNFAIKAGTVVEFAERAGVSLSFSQTGPGANPVKMPDVAERASQFTVPITCQK